MSTARLSSVYDEAAATITIELVAGSDLTAGWALALTSIVQLSPVDADLVDRLSSYHLLAPIESAPLAAGAVWRVTCSISHEPRHANDGPVNAYLVVGEAVLPVDVAWLVPSDGAKSQPTDSEGVGGDIDRAPDTPSMSMPAIVPFPSELHVDDPTTDRPSTLHLRSAPDDAQRAWVAVAALEARLMVAPRLDPAVGATHPPGDLVVEATLDHRLGNEAYHLEIGPDTIAVTASTIAGYRHAFVTLAHMAATGVPRSATIVDSPRFEWRGLHLDVARRWYDPAMVAHLIDVAAWRKLNRFHLHLTDDEAWRLPVDSRPDLGKVGGTRGHGRAIPPMFGGGPEPHGRAYTTDEIAEWNRLANDLGVTLVPEVDLPAHMHAALTADPDLRDPNDTSRAVSVQYYTDNVLVPGNSTTWPFVVDVIGAVAALFPDSPWIHIGADEVPSGSWAGSPAAERYRVERELDNVHEIEARFVRDVTGLIRGQHGRMVGAWEEAAESGGVSPADGYVVAWRTVAGARSLAARGFDVVVAPGQAYYLDMAPDDRWDTVGASWAGTTTFDDVCDFDPTAGWSRSELAHLVGIQACLWSEHVRDATTLETLLFPRLDAIAERAWRGEVVGGAAGLLARVGELRPSELARPPLD